VAAGARVSFDPALEAAATSAPGPTRKAWLAVELVLLFVGLPLLVWWEPIPIPKFPTLLGFTVVCYWLLKRWPGFDVRRELNFGGVAQAWRAIALRSLVIGPGLFAGIYFFKPEWLFYLPRNLPHIYIIVLFAYPFLSALPQEFLYRSFLHRRYECLLGRGWLLYLTSAVLFAFLHVIFDNWVAPLLTLGGGLLFAHTYESTRSLAAATLEHAIYGTFIFTFGYGLYFYEGL
jgi:membrane protease YdiL (CAAX protease family)